MPASYAPPASGDGAQLRTLFEKVAVDRERRIALARVSIAFFAWWYLRTAGRPLAIPSCHLDWYRAVGIGAGYRQRPYRRRKRLILAPRNHGKTMVAAYVIALHRICFNENIRILFIGQTAETAGRRVRRVRRELEQNKRILEDFAPGGSFRDPGAPWTDSYFFVKRSDTSLVDPTCAGVGRGGAVVGARYDLIIADDPEDDDSVLSQMQRSRTKSWWRATVQELLEPWGECVVLATRKHNDDLYSALIKDPTFLTLTYTAIIKWPEKWEWIKDDNGEVVDVKVTGDYEVLWPELFPIEALLLKRLSMTSRLFDRENQNKVTSDETSPFPIELLDAALARGKHQRIWKSSADVPEDWFVLIACDPAFVDDPKKAQETDTDYSFCLVIAVNKRNWHRRLIGGWRMRGTKHTRLPARIRETAAPFARPTRRHPMGALRAVAVENNSLGKMYEIGLKRDTDLPIVPHSTTSKKADPYEGVEAMGVLYENEQIDWANGDGSSEDWIETLDVLKGEMHGLGNERHDDGTMCHWIGECVIRRLRRVDEGRDKKNRKRPKSRRAREAEAIAKVMGEDDAETEVGEEDSKTDEAIAADMVEAKKTRERRKSSRAAAAEDNAAGLDEESDEVDSLD